ncbi:hypothetical protein RclHR1_00140014 [Rhizophagus clarus]|uniref:Uncharacterized protein n=1 Tax=Rhizophagus clarus TaxID=94130 RepID=A0A2Z6QBG0_9GLOM|nr:hypothetical protein RclHR1_00140014 [Rhizophagus clarus]GES77249.1 hypothetical protein GLOIN_2v1841062 [Rhizophagus clarus]
MYSQQYKKTSNISIQTTLNDFLNRANYDIIHQLPYNNNPQALAAKVRIGKRFQRLTGMNLMKRNVKQEAQRLQLHNQYLINLATNKIWNLKTTRSQRQQFVNLANNANNINHNMMRHNETLNRIAQINVPQVTNNQFGDNFFNGTNFNNDSNNQDIQSLILPAGSLRNFESF